jgi:hypothetical protein
MSTNDLRSFKKLTGKNYSTWSYTAKQRLTKKTFWKDIANTPETHVPDSTRTLVKNPAYKSWLATSASCIPDLVELIDEVLIPQIMNAGSAMEQWIILEQCYKSSSQLSQVCSILNSTPPAPQRFKNIS